MPDQPFIDRLMADTQLAELHAEAVLWRRQRFDALMLEEPNRALMGRLMMSPPARPLSMEAARFLITYGQRDARRTTNTA